MNHLYRVLNAVNSAGNAGPLVAAMITEEKDKEAMAWSTAKALSEMFGADVYYKLQGIDR
jgi:hypothetical protein